MSSLLGAYLPSPRRAKSKVEHFCLASLLDKRTRQLNSALWLTP
jgi:hypothetical protein